MELTWQMYNPESTAQRYLVLVGSLGGDTAPQWASVASQLAAHARIAFVYLPGQGIGTEWDEDHTDITMEHLAEHMNATLREIRAEHPEYPLYYAGLSMAGALGLYLVRDHVEDLAGVIAVASSLRSDDPEPWLTRADDVERDGTVSILEATQARWFTEDFVGYEAAKVEAIMDGLASSDDRSYAQLCRALAYHDISGDLADLVLPVLFIAGAEDVGVSVADLEDALQVMPNADLKVVADVAHQVPVAAPGTVADLILSFMRRLETNPWNVYNTGDDKE